MYIVRYGSRVFIALLPGGKNTAMASPKFETLLTEVMTMVFSDTCWHYVNDFASSLNVVADLCNFQRVCRKPVICYLPSRHTDCEQDSGKQLSNVKSVLNCCKRRDEAAKIPSFNYPIRSAMEISSSYNIL